MVQKCRLGSRSPETIRVSIVLNTLVQVAYILPKVSGCPKQPDLQKIFDDVRKTLDSH